MLGVDQSTFSILLFYFTSTIYSVYLLKMHYEKKRENIMRSKINYIIITHNFELDTITKFFFQEKHTGGFFVKDRSWSRL